VIRFTNNEIINNFESVCNTIKKEVSIWKKDPSLE
jgi:very-short-patch-repair endonuclease